MPSRSIRRLLMATLALLSCGDSTTVSPEPEIAGCVAAPPIDLEPVLEATERYCIARCGSDYSVEECRYYIPLDVAVFALTARSRTACRDAHVAELNCLAEDCGSPACDAAAEAVADACERDPSPRVPEPFDGAAELCTQATECWLDPSDPDFDGSVTSCLVEQLADLWARHHQAERPCVCELAAARRCIGEAGLACSSSSTAVDAACPMEAGALNLCTSDTICSRLGGGGGPSGCNESVSCAGSVYEVACEEGACVCTIDDAPGPSLIATDCSDAALVECGAAL